MVRQAAIDLARSVEQNYAQSKYWEFERFLGAGSYGVAVLVRERKDTSKPRTRMAVKLAQAAGVRELQKEIMWLKTLNGAKHIVKILAYCDDLVAASKEAAKQSAASGVLRAVRRSNTAPVPIMTAFDTLVGMKGPALAIEYIEGSDLLHFIRDGLLRKGERPPNKVLWSLFLCLVRATIGMAYPIGAAIGEPPILETIPDDARPERAIVHGDVAPRNVMIQPGDELGEHKIGQSLKLIDFGAAFEFLTPNGGPQGNLYDAAEIIINLFGNLPMRKVVVTWESYDTRAGIILPQNGEDPFPEVDLELRSLLARCMYTSPYRRPPLDEVFEIANNAVTTKNEGAFPNPERETPDAIRAFWQKFFFDLPE
ncbi:hypothetical protein ANO14919_017460 [Xylariales sp. No.14919]|nr:hypothetical protein ANO14919_017460 [Xylariales sp. No.14919]